MKSLLTIFLFFFPLLLLAEEEPFWEYVGGPNGGHSFEIHENKDNGNLYVSTCNGVYESSNQGAIWNEYYSDDFYYRYASGVSFDINSLGSVFGYTSKKEVFFYNGITKTKTSFDSINLLSTWTHYVLLDIDDSNNMVIIDQKDQKDEIIRIQYIHSETQAIDSTFLYRSKIGENEDLKYVYDVSILDSLLSVLIVVEDFDVKYSIIFLFDKSLNLLRQIRAPYVWSYQIIDSVLIGSSHPDQLTFRTNDYGKNWDTTLTKGGNLYCKDSLLYIFPLNQDSFYLSNDFGRNWKNKGSTVGCLSSVILKNNNIFLCGYYGVLSSNSDDIQWAKRDKGIKALKIYDMSYFQDSAIYASTFGIHKSTDKGKTWDYKGLSNQRLHHILVANNGYIFTAGALGGEFKGNIFRSTDDGDTWKWLDNINGDKTYLITDLYQNKRGHIFAGVYGLTGYFYSTDYGDNWNYKSTPEKSSCFATNSEGHIFQGAYGGIVSRSTDDGDTWEQMTEYYNGDNCFWDITSIAFDPKGGNGYALCLKTTDNGRTWIQDAKTPPDYSFCFDSLGNYLLYGWRSTDKGKNWEEVKSGLNHKKWSHLSVSPEGYYFLGAENGGLYRSVKKYVFVKEEPLKTDNITITPNPAKDYIEIIIPPLERGSGGVSVFDVLGQIQSTSVNFVDTSASGGQVRIDVSSLSPGVYFVRVGGRMYKFLKI